MEDSITDAQLNDWVSYYNAHPFGPDIEWYRTGTIAAMIGNTAPNRKAGARMMRPGDFVPKPHKRSAKGLREEMMALGRKAKGKPQSER